MELRSHKLPPHSQCESGVRGTCAPSLHLQPNCDPGHVTLSFSFLISTVRIAPIGLPWWFSDKESACQCRRRGFNLWSTKTPHATEQLSPCTTTIEPMYHKYWTLCTLEHVLHKRCHCHEKPAHRNYRVASTHRNAARKTQHSQK